jgi:hypothetical protein
MTWGGLRVIGHRSSNHFEQKKNRISLWKKEEGKGSKQWYLVSKERYNGVRLLKKINSG